MKGCIDIGLLAVGTKLTIGTPSELWELEVLQPETGLVAVTGTDKDFKHGQYRGRILGAVGRPGGEFIRKNAIMKGARIQLDFKNLVATTNRVDSVLIEGKDWHYEI